MSDVARETRNESGFLASPLKRVVLLATAQHGVAGRDQLTELGLSGHQIEYALGDGLLVRLHRGVYAVGHTALTIKGRWMAAALACAPDGVLSHRPAGALYEICPVPSGPIDVTTLSRRRHPGVRIHTVRALDERDVTIVEGIPVTSLARTYLDLAEVLNLRRLISSLEAAQRAGLFDLRAIDELMERAKGRRGRKPLRTALADLRDEPAPTRSEPEIDLLALIRRAGLPEPHVNSTVEGFAVDFCWPAHKLVVELDTWGFHRTRRSFEEDRRRDVALALAGYRTIRVTERRLRREPAAVLAELRALLSMGVAA